MITELITFLGIAAFWLGAGTRRDEPSGQIFLAVKRSQSPGLRVAWFILKWHIRRDAARYWNKFTFGRSNKNAQQAGGLGGTLPERAERDAAPAAVELDVLELGEDGRSPGHDAADPN